MNHNFERRDRTFGREVRACALDIKSITEAGVVEGYGSVFDNKDSYDDVIVSGAFKSSIAEHKAAKTMPAMLWQHDGEQPIGVWTDMFEDEKGLRIVGKLALDTVRGKEAYSLMKMGAINGLSIGFVADDWDTDHKSGIRTLSKIDLWEVSLVTFPANMKARVTNVKSSDELATPKEAERILRDAGFSKSDATAFVSRVMRMGEQRSDSAEAIAQAHRAAKRLLEALGS